MPLCQSCLCLRNGLSSLYFKFDNSPLNQEEMLKSSNFHQGVGGFPDLVMGSFGQVKNSLDKLIMAKYLYLDKGQVSNFAISTPLNPCDFKP